MLKTWNFKCSAGHLTTGVFSGRIPQTTACSSCRRRAQWTHQKGQPDFNVGTEMYGKFEPALGCVVESYEHKQQLLKEQNVMEAHDLVGGSRMYRVPEPPSREPDETVWGDNPDTKE